MLKIPPRLKVNTDRTLNSPPCHDWPSSQGHSVFITSAEPLSLSHADVIFFFNDKFLFQKANFRKLFACEVDAWKVPGSWHAI